MSRSALSGLPPLWKPLTTALAMSLACATGWAMFRHHGPAPTTETLTVFAAAGIANPLEEIAMAFTEQTGTEIRLNIAASSTLARQIESGAVADVYVSAHSRWIDYLEQRHLLAAGTTEALAVNRLALIAPRGQEFEVRFSDDFALADAFDGRLAVGDPDHVPAGMYATEALQHFGWQAALQTRLAPCPAVRAATRMVELGEARCGIVYLPEVAASERISLLGVFPSESHSPIRFGAAACRDASPGTAAFLQYLKTPEAAAVLGRHGFELPESTVRPHD